MKWFFVLLLVACAPDQPHFQSSAPSEKLYSQFAVRRKASFTAILRSSFRSIAEMDSHPDDLENEIRAAAIYVHGPLNQRLLGSIPGALTFTVDHASAKVVNGIVEISYRYENIWTLHKSVGDTLVLPVPYNERLTKTPGRFHCISSSSRDEILWYDWDPERLLCDVQLGVHYQLVTVSLGPVVSRQTQTSYPPYGRMIRSVNGEKVFNLTFGFSYTYENKEPHVFKDDDFGDANFRGFLDYIEPILDQGNFQQSYIMAGEYGGPTMRPIGIEYRGIRNDVHMRIRVLVWSFFDKTMLDPMLKSFAQDHDSFFGWYGHSLWIDPNARLFKKMLDDSPKKYTLTPDFQLLMWQGCDSERSLVNAFFERKAKVNPEPNHGLNIISTSLSGSFDVALWAAAKSFDALFHWEKKTSYQELIRSIEDLGDAGHGKYHSDAMLSVQGDNETPLQN